LKYFRTKFSPFSAAATFTGRHFAATVKAKFTTYLRLMRLTWKKLQVTKRIFASTVRLLSSKTFVAQIVFTYFLLLLIMSSSSSLLLLSLLLRLRLLLL
jgi:hypothetical protein